MAEGRPRPVRRRRAARLPRGRDARRRQDDLRAHGGAAPARRPPGAADRRRADRAPEAAVGARGGCVLAAPRPGLVGGRRARCPADMHGIVTSYQQVATSATLLRAARRRTRSSSSTSCTTPATTAPGAPRSRRRSRRARRRLALSGTPFRSDTRAIPFVTYEGDEAVPDFEYGYGDALADRRVVRPVYFPRTNGQMEWTAPDGSIHSATFDDRARRGAREPAAAHRALARGRVAADACCAARTRGSPRCAASSPTPAGLVIAIDQEHARGIAELLRTRFGTSGARRHVRRPARVRRASPSSPPAPTRGSSRCAWSPRASTSRACASASTRRRPSTELFFRQAVGRLVRWTRGVPRQRAWLFIPDDPRLRRHAARSRRAAAPLAAQARRRAARRGRAGARARRRGADVAVRRSSRPSRRTPSDPLRRFRRRAGARRRPERRDRADARAAAAARGRSRRSGHGAAHAQGGEARAARGERRRSRASSCAARA